MTDEKSAASSAPAIRMSGIVKNFGPVRANRGASLEVATGEIHALVGENGAGKSTLMRVLSGMYAPDAGTIEVRGLDVTGWNTAQAIESGVGMVHQHFMLVPTLTVAENVMLGREMKTRGVLLDRDAAAKETRRLSDDTGLLVQPDRKVSELTVGEAQRVEILKTLYRGASILILDEPTAVLSPPEVEELWTVLRRLRDHGGTIVLITHKLDEVMAVSDRITVMRHGETVERIATSSTSPAAIAKAMVGRDVTLAGMREMSAPEPRKRPPAPEPPATPAAGPVIQRDSDEPHALADAAIAEARARAAVGRATPSSGVSAGTLLVDNLVVGSARKRRAVDAITFEVEPGEILGIAGVEGNGQTELIEAIAGLRKVESGRIRIGNRDLTDLTVRERADVGLSHVPEDRHQRGLILDYTIADNLVLGQQHRFTGTAGTLDTDAIAENAAKQIAAYDIRPANAKLPARALSGGNQQKIVIAREMGREFSVLLAAQPTRGVDVGAIEFIHDQILAARTAGKAILLVSAELTEILALSDRIAVMYNGQFAAVLPRQEASAEILGRFMTGASEEAA